MREPLVEQVRYDPPPALRPFVASYTGYRLDGVPPGAHAGLPSTSLTFIVSFDDPLDIAEMPDDRQAPDTFWAMVGGLHVRPATVRHDGRQHGVQIELTPVTVAVLADELGWSRRHLTEQFRRSFGRGPKELARVVRFERAQQMLRSHGRPTLTRVAAACGYADQSHLTRDWRQFAGTTPSAWIAGELPFVQDTGTDDQAS